jgi:hypothetical protein
MKKISIIQPILDAIDETDGTVSKHMNQLIKWAKYIEKQIGSRNGYPYKSSLVTITGAQIDQPDDCYRVRNLLLGNHTDKLNLAYLNQNSLMVSVDNRYDSQSDEFDLEYVWQDLNARPINRILWEEVGDKISLADEFISQQMTIIYQYIETDEKGYWKVNDSHSESIKRYVIYMIAKKFLFKNFKSSRMTRNGDMVFVNDLKRDYNIAVRNARADDNKESPIDTTNGWKFATE